MRDTQLFRPLGPLNLQHVVKQISRNVDCPEGATFFERRLGKSIGPISHFLRAKRALFTVINGEDIPYKGHFGVKNGYIGPENASF